MIRWQDEGILLAARRHGESAVIAELFTPSRGRATGVVRGGGGRRMAPILMPGAQLSVTWAARLEAHMGHFTVELVRSRAPLVLGDRLGLAGLNAVCGLLSALLPEREAHEALYARTEPLLDLLGQGEVWPLAYLRWEVSLLEALGFGLDLSACAVTGARDGLAYVSPRSGRAVSEEGAGEWAARLLPLSPALIATGESDADIRAGLRVTGWFLEHKVAPSLGGRPLPAARQRFVEMI